MIVLRKYDTELGKRFTPLELEQKIPEWIQQLHADPQSRIPIVVDQVKLTIMQLFRKLL
jgi:hypothetical protein